MGIEERMSEADEWKKLYFELKSVAIDLEQQRDSFRQENERLSRLVVHDSEGRVVTQGAFNQLICQNERLREDAERYRKIRKYYWLDLLTDFFDVDADNASQLDEFIDSLGQNLNSDAAIDAAKEAER